MLIYHALIIVSYLAAIILCVGMIVGAIIIPGAQAAGENRNDLA